MTKTILAFSLALGLIAGAHAGEPAKAETRTVCVDKTGKDGKALVDKNGKVQQQCKTMKVHKKLEGTAVPGQTK